MPKLFRGNQTDYCSKRSGLLLYEHTLLMSHIEQEKKKKKAERGKTELNAKWQQ